MSVVPARLTQPFGGRWIPTLPSSLPMWLLLGLVAALTLTPTIAALTSAFRDAAPGQAGQWTLNGLTKAFSEAKTWNALWTTYWLALARAGIGVGLAVVITWILARTDVPFKRQLEFLIVVAYFFPGVGKLLAWVVLTSPRTGLLNQMIRQLPGFNNLETGPFNIYSYEGIIFTSVIGFSAFFVVFLLPAFRAMDASLEESARMCGATERTTLLRITAPLLKPAILGLAVLSLMTLLSSFETEIFLGAPAGVWVLTNRIYENLQQLLPADYATAFSLSLLLLASSLLLVFFYIRILGQRSYTTVSGRSFSTRVTRLGSLRWVAFAIVAAYLLLSLILPAIMLVYASFAKTVGVNFLSSAGYTAGNWQSVLGLRLPQTAFVNTLILAIGGTTIAAIIGTLVAYVITRTNFRAKRPLEIVAWIPWAIPTIVLGLGLLWMGLFTPLSIFYGTLPLLILAHVIRSTPLKTRIMASTIIQIDKGLEEAARIHGATWLRTFWYVWLPLVKNGFVAGWIIGFAFGFSELALVVFLYGPKSSVLSTLFLGLWSNGQIERAAVVGLITTGVVLAITMIVRRVTRTGLQVSVS